MAKDKLSLKLKIQMLAGKGTKEFFERYYKNLISLVTLAAHFSCYEFETCHFKHFVNYDQLFPINYTMDCIYFIQTY